MDRFIDLNKQTMPMIEEIGRDMPGGFFFYEAHGDEKLLYANRAVFEIYGCDGLETTRRIRELYDKETTVINTDVIQPG